MKDVRFQMKQSGNRLILTAALAAGLVGGAASARLWPSPASAFAEQQMLTSISAKQFAVMDDQGNVRIKLNVSSEGMAHVGLYDQLGVERASLVVAKEGTTMLAMSGDDGQPRLTANVAIHDGPAKFSLLNPDGSSAAELGNNKGARALVLADSKGRARVRLQANAAEGGEAGLTICDASGKPVKKFP